MRDKLNNSPVAQIGAIALLLIVAGFFAMSAMGGGEEEAVTSPTSAEVAPETSPTAPPVAGVPVEGAPVAISNAPEVPTPPLPKPLLEAFAANRTVVLLIVNADGVDDGLAARSAAVGLAGMSRVSVFVVPVRQIARYAAITQGVELERVPALVVVRPKNVDGGAPSASVAYGFLSAQSVAQAVVDARYRGRTLEYHP